MKINTLTELKTLDKQLIMTAPNELLTLGKAIGNILVSSETMNKLKAYSLGLKFYENDEVELDDADFETLKNELETTKAYTALITGQVLMLLNNLNNQKEEK